MEERMWAVFSPRHVFHVRASSAGEALVTAERAGLIDRTHDDLHIAEAIWDHGVLCISSKIWKFDLAEEGPGQSTLTDGKMHIIEEDLASSFNAPLRDAAVICVGYGLSRPLVNKYLRKESQAEIWTLNRDRYAGATRHFQIHDRKAHPNSAPENFMLDDLHIMVYTKDNYPFKKIRRQYLRSTVDYMLALADAEGFSRVYMPGLDFGGTRREIEVHSARYWIGILEGKGVQVFRSPLSRVFEGELYR